MKFLAVVLAVLCAALVQAQPVERPDMQEMIKNLDVNNKILVNEFFDLLLENMRNYLIANNLVPMPLPDSLQGFCVRYLFVDWHGELELTQGSLTDLSSISRQGDAEVTVGLTATHFKAVIGFQLLDINYDYLAYVMNIGPDGGIEAKVTKLTFNVDIAVNVLTGTAALEDLSVLHAGNLDVNLTGTIILDEIFNVISDIITLLFKNSILDAIALILKNAINDALTNTPIPTDAPVPVFARMH